ncbi:MAG: glutaminyl-peptide cyclotransferase [Bacteroidales bacterium]|nr:glutaminyl-peptide cyclotransferase [Bacteroidales bacterium]
MKPFVFALILIIAGFSGCSNKTNSHRKPVTNIQITPANKIVSYGNDISLSITANLFKDKLEKIELYINGEKIKTSNEKQFTLNLKTTDFHLGNHTITCKTFNKSGIHGINYAYFIIVSDIEPQNKKFEIVEILPHNTKSFTQGLEFYNDFLYESTGNNGFSKIFIYNPENQKIINSIDLENQYFGEGITILNDKLYQLTYKSKKGFIYDAKSLKKIKEFSFESPEGWGLTNDGKNIIMSDGSSKIHFLDTLNLQRTKSIEVCNNKGIISNLNELEYINGFIYANIWMTNTIIKIDPLTGKVLSIYNLSSLLNHIETANIDVLNGIAYNQKNNLFYLTGKYWPKMFKIKFED